VYGYDTFEAVLAFQKMNMTARTGRVDARLWRLLGRARTPRPRAGGGDHLEIDKSRQVLFEVRDNKVVTILHVSTGATGNTPVGRWRVYRKVAGWDWVLWYPMYFLRGFAIHGYPSVPAYPASHGCVRVPMWFAASLYGRWPMGATVWVFP
jgi:lipoprotein-anchoring transpeptidase ErfK/SrfK